MSRKRIEPFRPGDRWAGREAPHPSRSDEWEPGIGSTQIKRDSDEHDEYLARKRARDAADAGMVEPLGNEPRCTLLVRSEDSLPSDIRRCARFASEHPVIGRGRFEDHQKPLLGGLAQHERNAIDYLLGRPYADPDEDGNVVARAALRLDLARSRFASAEEPGLDVERLRDAGFEPPENVCAACMHKGGDHDLGNWCLLCPRPDVAIGPTDHFVDKRVAAGWCFFTSMTETQKWAHGAAEYARLAATPPGPHSPVEPIVDMDEAAAVGRIADALLAYGFYTERGMAPSMTADRLPGVLYDAGLRAEPSREAEGRDDDDD